MIGMTVKLLHIGMFNYYCYFFGTVLHVLMASVLFLNLLLILAPPQVSLESVKLKEDHMTVTWSYIGQSRRRKRSTSPSVSVVIYYQPDGGEEAHYPPEGSVAAEEREVIINGKFDVKAKYKVWLKVYEGGLAVSSLQTKPLEAAVETGTFYH